mmetsp:Transcript_72206/g.163916  ORF Transcript_72206/g.163916 Transcript_72206/m.163916 type:complete len:215 (-) Transcript_72206:518-1162(-)
MPTPTAQPEAPCRGWPQEERTFTRIILPATWASFINACNPPSMSRKDRFGNCVARSMRLGGCSAVADATANICSTRSSGRNRLVTRWPEGNLKETFRCSSVSAGSSGMVAIGSFGASGSAGSSAAGGMPMASSRPVSFRSPPPGASAAACGDIVGLEAGDIAGGDLDMENWSRNSKRYSAAACDSTHFCPSQALRRRLVRGSMMQMCGNWCPHW